MLARWLALVSILVVSTSAAHAEDAVPYVPPDFLSAVPPLPDSVNTGDALRLDLAQALQLAVRNNLNVALERREVAVAGLNIDVARGIFEPELDASYAHGSSRTHTKAPACW